MALPYLFISKSSRRPQFVTEDRVEKNWEEAFGSVVPAVEKKDQEERERPKKRMMRCNHCGVEKEYHRGMVAFCGECHIGILVFV